MSKFATIVTVFLVGCAFLIFLSDQLFSQHSVSSLGDMSSSTTSISSSTDIGSPTASSSLDGTNQQSSTTISSFFAQFTHALTSTTTDQTAIPQVNSTSKRIAFDFPTGSLYTTKGSIKVFIAHTEADREQGLSDISSLPQGVGVLFIFDSPGKYGFWMKDMHFPLDMIWINSDKMIAGVTKNVLPSSYPFVFMPPNAISYVLEVNAGSVLPFGLTTGMKVDF